MPRSLRSVEAGSIYHIINRGNGRMTLFHKPADFEAFERILSEGLTRYPVELLGYCLMGNHWHLLLRPTTDPSLGDLMRWVGVTHVRRHHAHYHTTGGGHLYQGRFKSFVVQDDAHFLTVCRYIEANPLRAGLVETAEAWPFSSLNRLRNTNLALAEWPVDRPRNWRSLVNQPLEEPQIEQIQTSIIRERPFGDDDWVSRTVKKLGLEWTVRPRGRPRKSEKE